MVGGVDPDYTYYWSYYRNGLIMGFSGSVVSLAIVDRYFNRLV